MPSYPTSVVSFTTKNTGDTIQGSHVNDLQSEVVALEGALVTTGLAHHLRFVDATYDIGASGATRPRDLYLSRNALIGSTLRVGNGVGAPSSQSTVAAFGQTSINGTWAVHTQLTTGITTATAIAAGAFGGDACGIAYVHGHDGAGARFFDIVIWTDAGDAISVLTSYTESGAPAARTYSVSGSNLRVAMASGTYAVNVLSFEGDVPQ